MWSYRNYYSLLVGMENSTATSKDTLAVSYEADMVSYQAITLFGIYSNELKTCPHKNLNLNVYRNFINNFPNLEETNEFFKNGE